jgi:hypothetical protein
LFIGFFSAEIAITLQHNVQLPQVLMGRFRHASRAAMKLRAAFNQRKGTLAHAVRKTGKQDLAPRVLMADKQEGPP